MAAARFESVLCMAAVLFVIVAMTNTGVDAAVTSKGQVLGFLMPCLGYLEGKATPPPPPCCQGVRNLNAAANTTPDRQRACAILKDVATSYTDMIKPPLAEALPQACNVNIPYKISMQTDCNGIH